MEEQLRTCLESWNYSWTCSNSTSLPPCNPATRQE